MHHRTCIPSEIQVIQPQVLLLVTSNETKECYSQLLIIACVQEPSADKDEDNCKRINDYLNNPSGSVPSGSRADSDLQSLLNNMSQSQLAQLFGGVGQMGGLHSLLGTVR